MNPRNDPDRPDLSPADIRAVLAGLGVDTQTVTNADGHPNVRLDREGLEKLRDQAAAHGAVAIAAAIDIALAEQLDDGGLS